MKFAVLKKDNLKRNIIIGDFVVLIISAVVLNFTRAKYRSTASVPVVDSTVNYTPYNFRIMEIYVDSNLEYTWNNNTSLDVYTSSTNITNYVSSMSDSIYTLDNTNSYCTTDNGNGEYIRNDSVTIGYSDLNLSINNNSGRKAKCYLYFDEYHQLLIDAIKEAYQNNSTIFAYDETVDNNLRYIGANPNNYVYFNCDDYNNPSNSTCELWRIIGIMNNMETASGTTELVKLIRNDSIGDYGWHTSTPSNDWSTSDLQERLNNNYLHGTNYGSGKGITEITRNMIEEVTWKLGGTSTVSLTVLEFYEYERGTTVYSGNVTEWVGEIGLMYPSDYGYATSGGDTTDRVACLATGLSNWDESSFSDCKNNDWLFNNSAQWTLTHGTTNSRNVNYVDASGRLTRAYASNPRDIRPSIYLKSNIAVMGGDGTIDSPFEIIQT